MDLLRACFGQVRIAQSSHYELKYTLGRKIVFICVAKGNPRPQITWFKDGIELYAHNFFKVSTMWVINVSYKLMSRYQVA